MNLKWLIPCLASSLLFASEITYPTQAPAQPEELQQVPIEKDIAATKLAEALKQAKTGDADAETRLGIMLLLGSEVEKNLPEARKWLTRAAQKGQKDAQAKLGAMLFLGLGGPIDLPQSLKWFSAAADQGDVYSMGCLGVMYATGTGVERSAPDAFFWLYLAKSGGDTDVTDQMLYGVASQLTPEQKDQILKRLEAFIEKQKQLHI